MKGKAKLKSPQKQPAKASLKNGPLPVTITEMFRRQSERQHIQSAGDCDTVSIMEEEEDDDVIFVKGTVVSPYFNKTKPNITNATYQKSLSSTASSSASPNMRKRKLSLKRTDRNFSNESAGCKKSDINTINFSCKSNENKSNINDIRLTKYESKPTEQNKEKKITQIKSVSLKRAKKTENKPEIFSELEDSFRSSTTKTGTCDPDSIAHVAVSSASCMADIVCNAEIDTDLDFRYSPVFSKTPDLTRQKSTVSEIEADLNSSCEPPCSTFELEQSKVELKQSDSDIAAHEHSCGNSITEHKEHNGDDDSDDEASANKPQVSVPYYLNNFETLLQSVMEDETNRKLFNDDDMACITTYHQLSESAKKLYIRMFSRKLHWIPFNKLRYPEIAEDLKPYLQELARAAFIDCDENLTDLEEVLNALTASNIKTLAKSYHVMSSVTQKQQLVQELLKKSQSNTLLTMFGSAGGGVAKTMITRAKKFLNGIYKLRPGPRGVFVRVLMLFSLVNTSVDDDSGNGGQGQLFQMLMVNMGKLVYPVYTVEKVHHVFKDRDDVIRFENALQLETDMLHCIERGNWEGAYSVFKSVEVEWKLLEADDAVAEWNKNLPDFLRSYTATSVINRLLSAGIEIFQRRKDYLGAIELLRKLLSQTTYNCSHRGYWWERLALNLDAHMKDPLESLEAVKNGLADHHVRVGHRFALYLRAENICQRPKLKLKHRLKEFYHETVRKTPKVYIEGRVLHQGVSTNGTRFLTEESCIDGNSHDMTVVGVEEYVLDYYKRNGFTSGVHAEGAVVGTLFSLFFWDILFMPVPDAFHSPFQAQPLDLHSDMFYERRRDLIEKQLTRLAESSVQELQVLAEETWANHQGVVCIGLNWERMSLDFVKELLSCMGGKVLSGIVGRFARCPRHTRSGFPDLTLWNAETGALKICEVKGPGDRLSHKQILWIDYLLGLGVDAEVCHVKAVAAKKLKPTPQ